ncbi:MAG: ATP-binding protein [Nitrospirota bacterium]|nr:ATP-binding protein [Nitrospirota bacterium]
MTISHYLRLTLAVSIGLVFAVGVAGVWMRDWLHQEAYENLHREMEVLLNLERVENGVLTALGAQEAFLSRSSSGVHEDEQAMAGPVYSAIADTRGAIAAIERLETQEGTPLTTHQSEIDIGLALFETRTRRLARLAHLRGRVGSGLAARLDKSAEDLEQHLEQIERRAGAAGDNGRVVALGKLRMHMLSMRRWEKDYFLQDDLMLLSRARVHAVQIERELGRLPLGAAERRTVMSRMREYMGHFERLALIDVQMAEERTEVASTAEGLTRALGAYVSEERLSLANAEARQIRRQRAATAAMFGLFLAVLLGAAVLAFRLTRRITGSLENLLAATREMGERGDCPEIHTGHDDEFARLAESFNSMVAQLREVYRQLVQSEKLSATGKLSASIAHEINNPLFGIQGCLERVQKRLGPEDPDRRLVELAVRESHRIARLVQGLRDYHRPSDRTMAPVSLLDTLDDVFLINEKYIQTASVTLHRDLPRDLPLVNGTRDQLQMVFVNLLTNAVEAMPEGGGRITVAARQEKGLVVVRVTDSGKGISSEALPRIFEPFFSTKPEVKGVGLGLSITYGIVKRHGGEISAVSEPGRTIFTVSLPVLSGPLPEAP